MVKPSSGPNGSEKTRWMRIGLLLRTRQGWLLRVIISRKGLVMKRTFAPVVRLEAIKIFLAYAAYIGFMVYQMDVKSAFLNGKISKEVYVQQPPRFESSEFPNPVCKLDKALYGLKQALRAWYETLSKFLIQHKFVRVKCPMLFPNNLGPDESGVSVNETLFRGMIGSLMYLIASRPDIQFYICLCARYQANPKESYLVAVKRIFRYLKGTLNLGLWYPKGSGFDLKAYSDSNYARCNLDRKSTSRVFQILGGKLVFVWIKSQLAEYDVLYDKVDDATKDISFSLSLFENRLSFTCNDFLSAIRLTDSENAVPLPSKGTARVGLATLAKLSKKSEESLILPFEEVNAKESANKSQSRTNVQPLSQPKAPTCKRPRKEKNPSSTQPMVLRSSMSISTSSPPTTHLQHAKEFVVTADVTKSLDTSESAEEKGNKPNTTDAKKVLDQIIEEKENVGEHSLAIPSDGTFLDDSDKQTKDDELTPESPFDTESEIKFIKSFYVSTISESHNKR
nr:hypothetical protein [Tanacetum cinerariifolium]